METFRSSQTLSALLIFLALALLIAGCSKDEDIVPSNGNGGTQPSKTIGSSGGEITFDNLTITIPPGAFSGDHKLELSISDKEHPFDNQELTSLYQIKGIPEDFSKSISIALKYSGTLEGETYIAHSIEPPIEGSDTSIVFDLLECKDSSEYLVGKLLPPDQGDEAKSEHIKLKSQQSNIQETWIIGTTKWAIFEDYPDYSFRIDFPRYLISDPRILNLPDNLELNKVIFESLYIKANFPKFDLPRKVLVVDNSHMSPHGFHSFLYASIGNQEYPGIPFGSLFIYRIFKDPLHETELDIQIGKTFFDLFQRYIYGVSPGPDWFSRATEARVEELFYDPLGTLGDYFPDVLLGNELDCFSGWGLEQSDVLVPIVKYLTDKGGVRVVGHYHDLIHRNYPVVEALNLAANAPANTWIPLFFQNYMEGKIYGITGDIFMNGIDAQDDLPMQGVQREYAGEYNDLSAKIIRFNTDNLVLNENANVAFDVESQDVDKGHLEVMIFSFDWDNNEIEFISDYSPGVKIVGNIKSLQEQNKDLLAVVVNTYKDTKNALNKSTISLKVELKETTPLNYRRFTVRLGKVNIQKTYMDGSTTNHENVTLELYMPFNEYGSFTGNSFSAGWEVPDGNASDSGFVEAVVVDDGTGLMLKSFEYKKIYTYDFENTRHMTGTDIPLEVQTTSKRLYAMVKGNELSNAYKIEDWAIRYYNLDGSLGSNSSWVSMVSTNTDSYLEVIFTDPE